LNEIGKAYNVQNLIHSPANKQRKHMALEQGDSKSIK